MTKEQVEQFMQLSDAVPAMRRSGIYPNPESFKLGDMIYEEWKNDPENFLKCMREWGFIGEKG